MFLWMWDWFPQPWMRILIFQWGELEIPAPGIWLGYTMHAGSWILQKPHASKLEVSYIERGMKPKTLRQLHLLTVPCLSPSAAKDNKVDLLFLKLCVDNHYIPVKKNIRV